MRSIVVVKTKNQVCEKGLKSVVYFKPLLFVIPMVAGIGKKVVNLSQELCIRA